MGPKGQSLRASRAAPAQARRADHAACSSIRWYARSCSLGVAYVARSLRAAGRFRQEVDVDEVGVDVDEARHALAAGGDEAQLGDGLHLGEATRPPGQGWGLGVGLGFGLGLGWGWGWG